jgi:hypothetical protein
LDRLLQLKIQINCVVVAQERRLTCMAPHKYDQLSTWRSNGDVGALPAILKKTSSHHLSHPSARFPQQALTAGVNRTFFLAAYLQEK